MRIDIAYESAPLRHSARTAAVQDLFGIGSAPRSTVIAAAVELDPAPGQVLLVTGPSGSGKSSILNALAGALGDCVVRASHPRRAGKVEENDLPLIDRLGCDLDEALKLLSVCGLSEAFVFLRTYDELSDGQKYRFRLATALARGARFVVADEFCSTLDRTTAKVIAYNLRKTALRSDTGFLLATAHDDLVEDLQPDILVEKGFGACVRIERRTPQLGQISFFDSLRIEPGGRDDWHQLAPFHYKSKHLGAVDKIFRLRLDAQTVGVVVYAYPAPHHSIRNRAFEGRYSGRLTARERRHLLNSELRVVQRIVIDPRLRGLGLASHLLRETTGLLDVPFIECLAVMAGYSRFLENAGFVCYGRTGLTETALKLLGALRGLGLDESTIHSPDALSAALRDLLPRHAALSHLLSSWWGMRKPRIPCPLPARLDALAREVARHITSRPFYHLYDNRNADNSKAPALTAGVSKTTGEQEEEL